MTTLNDLVGTHELSGVEFNTLPADRERWRDEAQACSFVLDGVVYTVTEDPDDGYRSSMESIEVGGFVANRFEPQRVLCSMQLRGTYDSVDDILVMRDATTGKAVLEIGTSDTDDYYPSFVANFDPTAMACNSVGAAPSSAKTEG